MSSQGDADIDRVLRPRPNRPTTSEAIQKITNGDTKGLSPAVEIEVPSRAATPVPDDAPPSAKSISSARKQARATAQKRLFHTINYTPRTSHFDPQSEYRDFKGFFVLFWMALAIMVTTTAMKNIKETGYPLRIQVYELLSRNVLSLAIADGLMVASTGASLYLHKLFRHSNDILQWRKGGIWVQSMYQAIWLFIWVEWPFILDWTWTAQVFFALHTLTFLMKMHSYAFYNGHLSEAERRLRALDTPQPGAKLPPAVTYPSSPSRLRELDRDSDDEKRRKKEKKKENIDDLRTSLATELTSPMGNITYPQNLTFLNFADYVLCPTLCYELEYPRTERIRWLEVFWKTLAVFGCIFLMTVVSEEFITPILADAIIRLKQTDRIADKGLILAESISITLFPFLIEFLLTFLVIWEYALGAFAELSCFADRHFYSDWWNCEDWLEFSREWNIPVYNFLKRHVYFSTRSYTSDGFAMALTFLISSIGHELIMGCISKKLRGYGAFAMMLQLPLVAIQRSKYVRGRWVLNNAVFWGSIILGITAIASLYVLV